MTTAYALPLQMARLGITVSMASLATSAKVIDVMRSKRSAPGNLAGDGYLSGSYPSGITSVDGEPTTATVRVVYRSGSSDGYGEGYVVAEVESGQDGTWKVSGLNPNMKFDVIGRLDGYNDVIVANVSPTVDDS